MRRHVQISNDGAIKFYEQFGFHIVDKKENYYKRIEPADAYVVEKTLRAQNSSDSQSKQSGAENNCTTNHV